MEGPKEFLVPKKEEHQISARKMQEELFLACDRSNFREIKILRQKFENEYPDQLEGVEALFGFVDCLRDTNRLDRGEVSHNEKPKVFQGLTEYNFLVSHFIEQNSDNKDFLILFWDALRRISSPGYIREYNIYKHGILTQVAMLKIFEKLGAHPTMSHPKQDAFNSIDMWTDDQTAFQIKGTTKTEKVELVEVKEGGVVGVPGILINRNNCTKYLTSDLYDQAQKFKVKFDNYKKSQNLTNAKAYFVVIPFSMIDPVTGDPTSDLVDEVKSKIELLDSPEPVQMAA